MKVEINNTTEERINLELVREVAEKFCLEYKISKDLSVAFVDDEEMQRLNQSTRGKNGVTDILSFEGDGDLFGELVIDYAQIRRQSGEFSNNEEDELVFIFVHGLFHLIGYTDETEDKRLEMIKKGEEFIAKHL